MTLIPDLAAPIAGWRIWEVMDLGWGPELVSPVRPVPWPPRVPTTATCNTGCQPCPSRECTCGLYAMAGLKRLPANYRGAATVLGCTALWGRVVEHAGGWRGEHGYPLVLFVTNGPPMELTRARRLRRAGLPAPQDDRLHLEDHVTVEGLARDLARVYAVPVHPAPPQPGVHVRGWAGAGWAAEAVRSEAADGLAGRRSGDQAAQDRLTRCARDLLDVIAG